MVECYAFYNPSNRLRLKSFPLSVLLISVFMKDVEPASVPKRGSSKATKATAKPQSSTTVTTAASARSTTAKSSSVRSTSP
ncbi:hypothetical protein CEXT_57201 [Caerostris extrusa]|uniref:Uncharacterized protein n=1 Tax=Caerostris extrusa TaxID=172846 RepID=A0AAV4WNK0_CAEEX|nr:hypothetical protein CEXT_57201 [Caerostris extrusa]